MLTLYICYDRTEAELVKTEPDNLMRVENLAKRFGRLEAVRGLNFGVRRAEVFGLLGVNGAGKTTTFRLLTGDLVASSGQASIAGAGELGRDRARYLRSVGYCPQFDCLLDLLTGRETLSLFGRLRGLRPGPAMQAEIERLAGFVELAGQLDKRAGSYSGGTRRKLCVAVALLGRPRLLLLDEPTTGVDPAARRKIWQTISRVRRAGTAVILTSHSMEECEALCDRLAIMVRGQFRCLGGPQHIKSKFGQGFELVVQLVAGTTADTAETAGLVSDVCTALASTELTEQHEQYLHFHCGDPATPWHDLFSTLERLKQNHACVQDYSVTETTLEQVFLSFARKDFQTHA